MSRRSTALLLFSLLLVTAGCVSVGWPPAADGEPRGATVTAVVDGDTVDVRFADGTTERVRLLGVDAPEVSSSNTPGEFEGVPDTEAGRRCLDRAADDATGFVEGELAGGQVRVVVDPTADRRDRYGRLLAYLVLPNGSNLNYRLVETGNARVYDSTFSQSERFYAAEARAQAEARGLWRCRTPLLADGAGDSPLRVERVHADATGDDRDNLGDEYVAFRNVGEAPLDLTGWAVRDEAGHVYPFPDGFVLAPNATVTLYTGSGPDTDDSLHWGEPDPVWNNDGDVVVVTNATGAAVVEYEY